MGEFPGEPRDAGPLDPTGRGRNEKVYPVDAVIAVTKRAADAAGGEFKTTGHGRRNLRKAYSLRNGQYRCRPPLEALQNKEVSNVCGGPFRVLIFGVLPFIRSQAGQRHQVICQFLGSRHER